MKGTIFAALVLSGTLALAGCGGGKPAASSGGEAPVEEAAPEAEGQTEPTAQVFESDTALAEFRGLQDVNPYIYVPFMLTNKTGVSVDVRPANVIVNGQANVAANGGSSPLAPIDPGNSGAVTASIALEFAGLSSIDEVTSISGDLELYDDASTFKDMVGSVHFDVVI